MSLDTDEVMVLENEGVNFSDLNDLFDQKCTLGYFSFEWGE